MHQVFRKLSGIASIAVLCCPGAGSSLWAQTQFPSAVQAVRDARAITILSSVLSALGGNAAIASIHDSLATGTETANQQSTTFKWSDRGGDDYRDESSLGSVIASSHGKLKIRFGTHDRALPEAVMKSHFPFHLPGVRIATILADPGSSIVYEGQAIIDDTSTFKVETQFGQDQLTRRLTRQTWYINTQTNMPVAVDFFAPNLEDPRSGETLRLSIGNFQTVEGVQIPFTFRVTADGDSIGTAFTLQTVKFNQDLLDSDFNLN